MKNKKNIILISGIILVVILIVGFIFFLGGEEYKMQMPKDAENYLSISLIKKDEKRLIENQENIQKLLDVLFKKERKTREESIQDIPLDVEGKIQMEFTFDKNSTSTTTVYAYKKKGKYGQCTQHRLNYNILEDELLDILRNICTSFLEDYDYEDIISKKMEINNKKLNDISKTITSFKKKLNKNNSIVDNLYKDKIEGLLSEKDFSRMYQEYTKDSNSLTDKIEDLQKELEQIKVENQDNKYDECKKIIQEFFKLKKPTRNVIARLVDRVEVSDKKEIDIYFKFKEISLMNN